MNLVEGLGLVIFLDEAGRYLKLGMTDLNTGDTGLHLETELGGGRYLKITDQCLETVDTMLDKTIKMNMKT